MKRFVAILTLAVILITFVPVQYIEADPIVTSTIIQPAAPAPKPPSIAAASNILLDAKTGEILWRQNSVQRRHMASTTKIMTAILAIEHGGFDETITVGKNVVPAGKEGGIRLFPGEKMKFRDLVYAMMLPSANDAAVAVAEHIGGSVPQFAKLMNKRALQIGAKRTNFVNPHGLDHRLHYSTAYDLALLARYALRNETFSEFVGTKNWWICRTDPKRPSKLINGNALLTSYAGTIGVKTGYTKKATNCLVSSAIRGDTQLIAVVLGAKKRPVLFAQSKALLDYGFSLYKAKDVVVAGTAYKTVSAGDGRTVELVAVTSVNATVKNNLPVRLEVRCMDNIAYPVESGAVLGTVIAYQGNRMLGTSDLTIKTPIY